MKPFLSLLVLLACGCSSLTKGQRFILEGTDKLRANNASFYFEVHDKRGITRISFANPTIGFSASASDKGVTQNSPTNLVLQIGYQLPIASPTTPQSTNQPTKK